MDSGNIFAFNNTINKGCKMEIHILGMLTKINNDRFTLNSHDSINKMAM